MSDKFFVDSNIFLYAFMGDDDEKSDMAFSIIADKHVFLSTQVVNEICINLIKKSGYQEDDIAELVNNIYKKYQVVIINKSVILRASFLRRHYLFSYWDSLIISTALNCGCNCLFTEDMQHSQIIENKLKIVNPFLVNNGLTK